MSLFISASVIPSVFVVIIFPLPATFLQISSWQLLKNSMLLLSFVSHEFIWYDAVVEPLLSSSVKIQHLKSFFNLQPLIVPNYCNWYLLEVQTVYKLLSWRSLVCIIFKKHLLYGSTPTEKSKSSRKLSRRHQSSQVRFLHFVRRYGPIKTLLPTSWSLYFPLISLQGLISEFYQHRVQLKRRVGTQRHS